MSINVTDVVSQFGAFYKPGSDNQKNLRSMVYKAKETAQLFQERPTEDTIFRSNLATLTRVVQPFQKAFTPIATIDFKPNQFDLFKLKIDLQETPDDLEASYLGFLANMEELDRSKWPFVRWFIESHVMPKKDEDLEVGEYFGGVFAAVTPGTAGAVGTAMNGLRKVIRDYNGASRLNLGNGPIAMGVPATDPKDFCTQVEDWFDAIPDVFANKIDVICMSKTLEKRYRKGKRAKYGMDVNFLNESGVNGLLTIEDHPEVSVKGLLSHGTSDLIWATIPENRIRPVKKAKLANTMSVNQFAPRVVSLYTDWWESLNFEVPEFVFTNDQDLA